MGPRWPRPVRGLRARRGHAHARVGGCDPGAARGRRRSGRRRRAVLGHEPSPVRRRAELCVPRVGARLRIVGHRSTARGIGARGHGGVGRRGRRGRGGNGPARTRHRVRRGAPGPGNRLRSAVRRGCRGVRRFRARRGDRLDRHARITHAAVPRPLPRRRRDRQPRSLRRPLVPRRDLPAGGLRRRRRARAGRRARRGHYPTPTDASARRSPNGRAPRSSHPPTSTRPRATPARPPRSSAARSHSTPKESSRSSAPAAAGRPA